MDLRTLCKTKTWRRKCGRKSLQPEDMICKGFLARTQKAQP